MPQVDFYILAGDAPDARLTVACRIAEKAMKGDLRVFVRASNAGEADRLDALLWTFSQNSFVPHRVMSRDEQEPGGSIEPVLIGVDEPAAGRRFGLLINLAPSIPVHIDCYDRIAELIDGDEERRALGRERYRTYRDRGCRIDSHNV